MQSVNLFIITCNVICMWDFTQKRHKKKKHYFLHVLLEVVHGVWMCVTFMKMVSRISLSSAALCSLVRGPCIVPLLPHVCPEKKKKRDMALFWGHNCCGDCMKGFRGEWLQCLLLNLLRDSNSSSIFSALPVSAIQFLHSVFLLQQLYFLSPFLHLYFFLMSNSDSKLFLFSVPISDSIQSPAHVLIFLAELYSVKAFVSLAIE